MVDDVKLLAKIQYHTLDSVSVTSCAYRDLSV